MPESRPKVSVVVSCYNYGGYLASAVQSALAQTYPNIEVVIVDDGSTDDTPEVVKWLSTDPRVVSVRQSNQGQAAAKNAGILRSGGDFIAFLDADDRWTREKLEKQMPLFANPAVGVVYSLKRPLSPDGKPLERYATDAALHPRRGRVCGELFIDNFVPFSSAVVRRSVFDRIGTMDTGLSMGIDWDLWLRASLHYEFDYVNEPLLEYREGHAGQMSRKQEERNACADRIMTRFLKDHPEALPARHVRRAWSYTYNRRGFFYRLSDPRRSTSYYLRS
ncbi:MAG: glycosyltransferase family 2 protein, partial [Elusimicrobia bacterium]|nr:glycosyltransferase family 2 protein [Elusimicrobiota bacterium]